LAFAEMELGNVQIVDASERVLGHFARRCRLKQPF
jgi:hypothetical protein